MKKCLEHFEQNENNVLVLVLDQMSSLPVLTIPLFNTGNGTAEYSKISNQSHIILKKIGIGASLW